MYGMVSQQNEHLTRVTWVGFILILSPNLNTVILSLYAICHTIFACISFELLSHHSILTLCITMPFADLSLWPRLEFIDGQKSQHCMQYHSLLWVHSIVIIKIAGTYIDWQISLSAAHTAIEIFYCVDTMMSFCIDHWVSSHSVMLWLLPLPSSFCLSVSLSESHSFSE